jgi:hypothetical protein
LNLGRWPDPDGNTFKFLDFRSNAFYIRHAALFCESPQIALRPSTQYRHSAHIGRASPVSVTSSRIGGDFELLTPDLLARYLATVTAHIVRTLALLK